MTRTHENGPQCVVDARAEAGESPVWCTRENVLYWVDIWRRQLHRYDPRSRTDAAYPMPDIVTYAAPHEAGGMIVCLRSSVWHVDLDRSALRPLVELPLAEGERLNDAAIDPSGRLWVGSMASTPAGDDGALWCIDLDGKPLRVVDRLRSPNGLAFSPDERTLYLSDSHPSVRTIWAFGYEAATGRIGERRMFRSTTDLAGRPDGACVDSAGRYWMAAIDGWSVLCLGADGGVMDSVKLPVEKPSKPAFGGPGLATLYVTSLRRNLLTPLEGQPLAGGLFAVAVEASGVASPPCRIGMSR